MLEPPSTMVTDHLVPRAYPLTLSPAKCGHSFCAICVLKWFFSRMHRQCGKWHESLECPICRTELPSTPEATRSMKTCPFTPNRLADSVLTDLINSLTSLPGNSDGSPRGKSSGAGRSTHSKNETTISTWAEDGSSRKEWLRRVRYVFPRLLMI